jgi:hypothetical protein
MKKEVKKRIVMITMLSAILSYANNTVTFKKMVEIENTILSIHDVKQEQKLVIKDYYGVVLYKEFIETSGVYSKGFDLTALPNGEYYFEVDKDLEVQVIPFKVQMNNVEFLKEKETKFFKPVLRFKDNKVLLSRLSFENNPLEIKIYYDGYNSQGYYELIHTEKIKDIRIIERIYALDKTKKGNYRVVVKTEGREFTESITI